MQAAYQPITRIHYEVYEPISDLFQVVGTLKTSYSFYEPTSPKYIPSRFRFTTRFIEGHRDLLSHITEFPVIFMFEKGETPQSEIIEVLNKLYEESRLDWGNAIESENLSMYPRLSDEDTAAIAREIIDFARKRGFL